MESHDEVVVHKSQPAEYTDNSGVVHRDVTNLNNTTVEDRARVSSIMHNNGQLLCKHATIAGAKDGGCERYGQEVCHDCKQPFCPDHASVIDPFFCSDCLSPQTTELIREPLTETLPNGETVVHNGIHITPGANATAFKSLSRQICEMTDEQLTVFIREEGVKVKQAESVRDYHMIAKSSAIVEVEERAKEASRQRRATKIDLPKIAALSGSNGGDTDVKAKGLAALAGMLKGMGIAPTPENLAKFAMMLAAKRGKKP